MVRFNQSKMTVSEIRRLDNIAADIERNKAYTDYIAMMNGVELPMQENDAEVTCNEE